MAAPTRAPGHSGTVWLSVDCGLQLDILVETRSGRAVDPLHRNRLSRAFRRIGHDTGSLPSTGGIHDGLKTVSHHFHESSFLVDVPTDEWDPSGFLSHWKPDSTKPPAQPARYFLLIVCIHNPMDHLAQGTIPPTIVQWFQLKTRNRNSLVRP